MTCVIVLQTQHKIQGQSDTLQPHNKLLDAGHPEPNIIRLRAFSK